MKPVELIGCGALNLDLIYRLPRSFPLWDELGPPGTEQLMEPVVRKAVDEALAHIEPVRAGPRRGPVCPSRSLRDAGRR